MRFSTAPSLFIEPVSPVADAGIRVTCNVPMILLIFTIRVPIATNISPAWLRQKLFQATVPVVVEGRDGLVPLSK